MIFVILLFEKSIDVSHQPNTALLKYLDSLQVQPGSCPCYTRRLPSHYKKAVVRIQEDRPSYHYSPFWQSKTTCFTFQSHRFCLPKYATFEGKTTCFTSSTHILPAYKPLNPVSLVADGCYARCGRTARSLRTDRTPIADGCNAHPKRARRSSRTSNRKMGDE